MDSISLYIFLFFTVKILTNAILCVYVHRIFVLKKCNLFLVYFFFTLCYVLCFGGEYISTTKYVEVRGCLMEVGF